MLAGAAVVAGAASGAWACVPQPVLTVEPQASGAPGARITVDGMFVDGDVEIRWNGVDGPELATTSGPHFSVAATVPEAVDGLYAILAVSRAPDGSVNSVGRAPFLVTSAPGAANRAPVGLQARLAPAATGSPSDARSGTPAALTLAEGAGLGLAAAAAGLALGARRRRSRPPASGAAAHG
ncbi:MAG TPA: hypothetical protein VFJ85_07935 [Acidimicrobiales bacterium]|nr:hypothetical protein [Acidimicrobiales bacterium]